MTTRFTLFNRLILLFLFSASLGAHICLAETLKTHETNVADLTTDPVNPMHQPGAPATGTESGDDLRPDPGKAPQPEPAAIAPAAVAAPAAVEEISEDRQKDAETETDAENAGEDTDRDESDSEEKTEKETETDKEKEAEKDTDGDESDTDEENKEEIRAETPAPRFAVTQQADIASIDEPKIITYTITIKNTGNLPLTRINIAPPLLADLEGPEGDNSNPGILDVDEIWTYTGTYNATQAIIDGNGVDTYNAIDGDGDIDSTVMVSFAETDAPQTAYAVVATNLSITGDIFEKKYRYLHGFVSVKRLFTSNLYRTDSNAESCWATFLTPGIWATYPSNMKRSVEIVTANASPGGLAIDSFNPVDFRRFQAYVLYSPQLEIYHDQNLKAYQDPDLGAGIIDDDDVDNAGGGIRDFAGQNSVNRLAHRMDAMLHYHSGNMLAIRAIDQYKISYDAFSERAFRTDDKFTSNMFNLAGTIDPTKKLQLRLDYTNFRLDYRDAFNRDDDRMDNAYAAYLFFRLTGKTSLFLEYDFADIAYRMSPRDSHEHRYFAGVRWEMTKKSSGQIKGGFGRKTTDDSPMIDTDVAISDISKNNWMAAIQIDHNFTPRTNMTLNAYRRFDEVLEHRYDYGDFEHFYADYILAHFGGVKLSWNVVSNIHLNLDTSLFYDEFKGSRQRDRDGNVAERKDLDFAVSPSVAIDLCDFEHCSINVGYIYTDHDSNYPTHDYFDHTFFARVSLFL